jgi:hypothetical protein
LKGIVSSQIVSRYTEIDCWLFRMNAVFQLSLARPAMELPIQAGRPSPRVWRSRPERSDRRSRQRQDKREIIACFHLR